ncbi:2-hydroxyacid dehydrogenase [Paraburkholderia guartelaensis]|uniref:2-hydroxyacid dehydrogenase n=1 Tax=Paraburkholderia guartelaensis TaxID=2546446 RepID=UPI002AB62183|nr:2-hydroxyacid dehydrogenase [Paraburkholderia guartelaensis]
MNKPLALQLCPFSDFLENELSNRFEIVHWFSLSPAQQQAWLSERAQSVRAVVTGGHIGFTNELMDQLPSLGVIAINGVGFDKVDLPHARERGVGVTNTPDVLTEDVADLAIGLIISLLRRLPAADAHVRAGQWPSGDMPLARKVSGRRFGIVGLGRIGSAIASRVAPFGPVAYTDLTEKPVPYSFHGDILALAEAVDVLIVASSANAATRHLIAAPVLDALGPNGYLVNVARGSLVDEQALIDALAQGRIAGAALDVFEAEPNVPEALRTSDKVVVSPHIASATQETRRRMAELVLENLDAFVAGKSLPTALF